MIEEMTTGDFEQGVYRSMKVVIMVILGLILSACQTYPSYVAPVPLPDFIIDLDTEDLSDEAILYMVWRQEPMWDGGMDGDLSLYEHIRQTKQITIDGIPVADEFIDMRVNLMSYSIFDDNRQVIGMYGGNMSIYIMDYGLEVGVHTLDLKATNLSGEPFSYTTDFVFNPYNRNYIPATLVRLPAATN